MARGWESKSVEAQQDEAAGRSTPEKPRLTREAADRLREREDLRLSLESVVQRLQRSRHPRYRAMLEQALADLQRKLESLGAREGTARPSDH
jgi:hypothetical protein